MPYRAQKCSAVEPIGYGVALADIVYGLEDGELFKLTGSKVALFETLQGRISVHRVPS